MKKHRRLIQILILSAVVVIAGITIASSLFKPSDPLPQVGHKAPNFVLNTLDGSAVELDDYKGKYVVLNFWGSFCEPCVDEMPLLQDFHEEYNDQGLVVLGVNLNEPLATVRGFVQEHKIHFPILLDKDHIRKKYGVMYYPTTFFIRPDGEIDHIFIGELNERTMAYHTNRLLSSGDS